MRDFSQFKRVMAQVVQWYGNGRVKDEHNQVTFSATSLLTVSSVYTLGRRVAFVFDVIAYREAEINQ